MVKLTIYHGLALLVLLFPVVTVCLGIHLASWISLYALVAGSMGLIAYGFVLFSRKASFPGRKWMAALSLIAGLCWLVVQLYMLSGWKNS